MEAILPDPKAIARLMRRYRSNELSHFVGQLLTSWVDKRSRIEKALERMPQDKAVALATLLALFDLSITQAN